VDTTTNKKKTTKKTRLTVQTENALGTVLRAYTCRQLTVYIIKTIW